MAEAREKDIWDKMVPLPTLLASVLIPAVLAVIGNLYTSAIKQSENRVKYTELAMNILKDKPTAGAENLREWAADVVDQYSGVRMTSRARSELERIQLSFGRMDESDFAGSSFKFSRFDKAPLVGASFNSAFFRSASFRDASFPDTDFRGADLSTVKIDASTKLPRQACVGPVLAPGPPECAHGANNV